MNTSVSALYVDAAGPYPALVRDCWDVRRDARRYVGMNPVVAHPPCARWGKLYWSDGSAAPGDDGGLFAAALCQLYRCGGVLEHPAWSRAWERHGLPSALPGSWQRVMAFESSLPVWTTQVAQRNYGHLCEKMTWLLYVGEVAPVALDWSPPGPPAAWMCSLSRRAREKPGFVELKHSQRHVTPLPFARLLVSLASQSSGRNLHDTRESAVRVLPLPDLADA